MSPERLDDPALPPNVGLVRTSPEFNESSLPAGLRRAHRIAPGVWGRLVVREGSVAFAFDDAPTGERIVAPGEHQVIPPERSHHVRLLGPVRLVIEFHAPRDTGHQA